MGTLLSLVVSEPMTATGRHRPVAARGTGHPGLDRRPNDRAPGLRFTAVICTLPDEWPVMVEATAGAVGIE